MGECVLDSSSASSDISFSKNSLLNKTDSSSEDDCNMSVCNVSVEKSYMVNKFFKFTYSGTESSKIFLLSILFTMSGIILFIYGLLGRHPYPFIMSFETKRKQKKKKRGSKGRN